MDGTPGKNLACFAGRTTPDTIVQPTDTVRGISVTALTPQRCAQFPPRQWRHPAAPAATAPAQG